MIFGCAEELLANVRSGKCGSIDCLIFDPPYSEHVHTHAVSNNPGGVGTGTHYRDLGFDPLTRELVSTLLDLSALARRWTVLFSDIESVGSLWHPLLGDHYIRAVPWVRWSQPQKSGDRPGSGCEIIVTAHPRGAKWWNGPGSLTHFSEKCLRGKDKHPTEKPLDLMLSLVSWFSAAGQTVVDPCCGAGTTALACRLLNRRFLGAETQGHWREFAGDRARAPLSEGDRRRVERWLAVATKREAGEAVSTPAALERQTRRVADLEMVSCKIKK